MAETQPGVGKPVDGAHTDRTVRELRNDALDDLKDLLRLQRQLTRLELRREGRTLGVGTAMFVFAGLIGHLVLILASVTLGLGLWAMGLQPWLAFLVVTLVYVLLAALLVFLGIRRFKRTRGMPLSRAALGQLMTVLTRGDTEETAVDLPGDRHPERA